MVVIKPAPRFAINMLIKRHIYYFSTHLVFKNILIIISFNIVGCLVIFKYFILCVKNMMAKGP